MPSPERAGEGTICGMGHKERGLGRLGDSVG